MHPTKAHDPDGMPALFYQKMWDIVGNDVVSTALEVLKKGVDPSELNSTFLCFKKPKHTREFRLISLYNVIFKIITKTMANISKLILPHIVDEFQNAFVSERLITDNGLVAFDIFHYIRKKTTRNKGFVGMKLDMAKAYDRIEWNFLKEVFVSIGFPAKWIDLVWRCISITYFSILLNGISCKSLKSSRGLR